MAREKEDRWPNAKSLKEALENVRDALAAVVELYEDLGKPLPEILL